MPNYGLAHAWYQGNVATQVIALVLLSMSILSWTIIVIKSCDLWRLTRLAKQVEIIDSPSTFFNENLRKLNATNANPFLTLAHAAQVAVDHYQNQPPGQQHLNLSDWLTRCLTQARNDSVMQLQRGLGTLASIGSSAPFIGLLGTVIGIYQALLTRGATQFTALAQLTGPLGEALIMTAGGLFVAIPAVLAYNLLSSGNKTIVNKLNRYAHQLHVHFMAGRQQPPVT